MSKTVSQNTRYKNVEVGSTVFNSIQQLQKIYKNNLFLPGTYQLVFEIAESMSQVMAEVIIKSPTDKVLIGNETQAYLSQFECETQAGQPITTSSDYQNLKRDWQNSITSESRRTLLINQMVSSTKIGYICLENLELNSNNQLQVGYTCAIGPSGNYTINYTPDEKFFKNYIVSGELLCELGNHFRRITNTDDLFTINDMISVLSNVDSVSDVK